jgi:hypothetical protein
VPGGHGTVLTDFQVEVAKVFFSLPSSEGFLLAGGAALVAQRLTARPTQDLDFFTRPGAGEVGQVRDEFVAAAAQRGWQVERTSDADTFCRLLVHGAEDLIVDLALESTPGRPASASFVGPTFDPEELAGRKVIALFDRAAARDFVDVYQLANTFAKDTLLERAAEVDVGFEPNLLADMFSYLERYTDADLTLIDVDVAAMREFFARWRDDLRGGH